MKQTAPVVYGAQGGWEAHLREVAEGGFRPLEELQEEYGEEHHSMSCGFKTTPS